MKIIKNALINSLLALIYIALIAALLTNAPRLFGQVNNILSGIAFLLTFVLSAAIMGIIILGRPILWYLNGFKKEAVKLIFYTLGFLIIILVIIFLMLIV